MKIDEIVDVILKVEEQYKVSDWELDGVPLWPLIRLENYYLMSIKSLNESTDLGVGSSSHILALLKAKWRVWIARIKDIKMNQGLTQSDVIFLGNGVAYAKLSNKWYDKFCDPLVAKFNKRGVKTLRLDLGHAFYNPRVSASKYIQPSVDNVIIRSMAKSKISTGSLKNEIWGDYEKFINDPEVKKHFIKIPSKEAIRKRVKKINALAKYFDAILNKVTPKLAFLASYYGDQQLSFILACKRKGIPTVDIQHGVQNEFHLGYGNWTQVPKEGYKLVPDKFLVWSQIEKKNLDAWNGSIDTHKGIVGGNLFGSIWKDNNNELVSEYDKEVQKIIKDKKQKTILLTLSPYTDNSMPETWKVVFETQNEYNWLIRLHPCMMGDSGKIKKELSDLGIIKYELDKSSLLPLYSVLRNIDLHVTVQSTCVIESAEFNVNTIITSDYGNQLFHEQVSSGHAVFHLKEQDIILGIQQMIESDKKSVTEPSGEDNDPVDELVKLMN